MFEFLEELQRKNQEPMSDSEFGWMIGMIVFTVVCLAVALYFNGAEERKKKKKEEEEKAEKMREIEEQKLEEQFKLIAKEEHKAGILANLSEEQKIERYAVIEEIAKYYKEVHGWERDAIKDLRLELEELEQFALLGRVAAIRKTTKKEKETIIATRIKKKELETEKEKIKLEKEEKAKERAAKLEAKAKEKAAAREQEKELAKIEKEKAEIEARAKVKQAEAARPAPTVPTVIHYGSPTVMPSVETEEKEETPEWRKQRKFVASRISSGNTLFPAEVTLKEHGMEVKFPGFFRSKANFISYNNISGFSVSTPLAGFSTITFMVRGDTVEAHGFKKSEARAIQKAVNGGGIWG